MKRIKKIGLYSFLATLLLVSCRELAAKNNTPPFYTPVNTFIQNEESKSSDTILSNNSLTAEGLLLKTAHPSSRTPRAEERISTVGLGFSFYEYSHQLTLATVVKSRGFLRFTPQQQKIIFPYHHFW